MRKSSFPPVVTYQTRLLILGSLPGEASLAAGCYYAHPANQFWKLVSGVIERDIAGFDYAERLAVLTDAGVGLWDTVASATRRGSLDTAIRAVEANPLADLVDSLPHLVAVGFNGGTSARLGRRALAGRTDLALVQLPSSSAAYCRISLAEKHTHWNSLRKFLVRGLQFSNAATILSPIKGSPS